MPEGAPRQPGHLAYALRALGRAPFPPTLDLAGQTYHLHREIKHDFFAATAFYIHPETHQLAVYKAGRNTSFYGLPLTWVGRLLRNREVRFYRALADLPNVPNVLAELHPAAFVHAYVQGRPLEKGKPCPDGFFTKLQELMRELHRRNIAYVDTNKPQNILLGDDGLPHLIDFQISWDLHGLLGNTFLNRAILRRLQREDLYHILKHKRRIRPDELTEQEKIEAARKSWFIKLHRILTRPYFILRRSLFARLRKSGRLLPEGSD